MECAVVVVQGKARRRRIANLFKGKVRSTERVHMEVHPGPNGGAGQRSHSEQRRHAPPQPRNPPRSALTHWVNLEYAYFFLLLILLTHSRSGQLLFLGLRNDVVDKRHTWPT